MRRHPLPQRARRDRGAPEAAKAARGAPLHLAARRQGTPLRPLAARRGHRQINFVEGESDAWTLWHSELPAVGLPGASTWKEAWRGSFQGVAEVYVWREPDQGGDRLVSAIASDLPDIRVIDAPPEAKDPNALWIALGRDPAAFRSRMAALLASARRASDLRAEALTREARDLYTLAGALLLDAGSWTGSARRSGRTGRAVERTVERHIQPPFQPPLAGRAGWS